jgi:hypothetical protein
MYFNNNGLDTAAAERIQEIFLHQKPTKLHLFHCFNNLLRDGGAIALAPVISNSPQLTDVRFSATRFGVQGGKAISESLQSTPLLGKCPYVDHCTTTQPPDLVTTRASRAE